MLPKVKLTILILAAIMAAGLFVYNALNKKHQEKARAIFKSVGDWFRRKYLRFLRKQLERKIKKLHKAKGKERRITTGEGEGQMATPAPPSIDRVRELRKDVADKLDEIQRQVGTAEEAKRNAEASRQTAVAGPAADANTAVSDIEGYVQNITTAQNTAQTTFDELQNTAEETANNAAALAGTGDEAEANRLAGEVRRDVGNAQRLVERITGLVQDAQSDLQRAREAAAVWNQPAPQLPEVPPVRPAAPARTEIVREVNRERRQAIAQRASSSWVVSAILIIIGIVLLVVAIVLIGNLIASLNNQAAISKDLEKALKETTTTTAKTTTTVPPATAPTTVLPASSQTEVVVGGMDIIPSAVSHRSSDGGLELKVGNTTLEFLGKETAGSVITAGSPFNLNWTNLGNVSVAPISTLSQTQIVPVQAFAVTLQDGAWWIQASGVTWVIPENIASNLSQSRVFTFTFDQNAGVTTVTLDP